VEPYVKTQNLPEKASRWLQQIKQFNSHELQLDSARSALLVIDMQNFFLDPKSPTFTAGGLAILPVLKGLVGAFRNAGRPVIFTRHVHHPDHIDSGIMGWWWPGMCIEGSPESEVHPELAPLPSEKSILKHRYSAFYNTDLETVLRCQGIQDLVVTGIMTNLCCESTARDAYFRDYRVFFLADGTGSINEEMHLASLLNIAYGFGYVTLADRILEQLAVAGGLGERAAAERVAA
jgi:nicotinamidase-related amidase